MKNGCANRTQSRACLSYAEVKPAIDEVNEGCCVKKNYFFVQKTTVIHWMKVVTDDR